MLKFIDKVCIKIFTIYVLKYMVIKKIVCSNAVC